MKWLKIEKNVLKSPLSVSLSFFLLFVIGFHMQFFHMPINNTVVACWYWRQHIHNCCKCFHGLSRNTITDQMFTSNGLGSALGDEKWIFSKKDLVHNNLIRIENPIRALKSTEQFRLCFMSLFTIWQHILFQKFQQL